MRYSPSRVGNTAIGILEPLLQQRFQLAHILEAQIQGLESGNGGLGEVVSVEFSHRQPHVALGKAELYPSLFERFGKLFQFLQIGGFLGRRFKGTWSGIMLLELRSVSRRAGCRWG